MAKPATPPTRRKAAGSGHSYIVDGTSYAGRGVTTLIKNGAPSPALMYWAAREVADAALDEQDVWRPMVAQNRRQAAWQYLKEAPWSKAREAAARGTDLHRLAHRLAQGEEVEVDESLSDLVDSYLQFREDWRPVDELVEVMVVNRSRVYEGSFDLLATLEASPKSNPPPWWPTHRPAKVLIDIKTSGKGIYSEAALQLAAYRNAEVMLPGLKGFPEDELPMPQVDGCAVLWVRSDGYELVPVEADESAFRLFLYVAEVAGWAGRDGWGESAIGEALTPAPLTQEAAS